MDRDEMKQNVRQLRELAKTAEVALEEIDDVLCLEFPVELEEEVGNALDECRAAEEAVSKLKGVLSELRNAVITMGTEAEATDAA
jgi:hypothetical protein